MVKILNFIGGAMVVVSGITMIFGIIWMGYFEEYISDGPWGLAWLVLIIGAIMWILTKIKIIFDKTK